jgi:O-Antigen ligase
VDGPVGGRAFTYPIVPGVRVTDMWQASERRRARIALAAFASAFGYATFAQGGFYPEQAAILASVLVVGSVVCGRDALAGTGPVVWGLIALGVGLTVAGAARGWTGGSVVPALTLITAAGGFFSTTALIRRGEREGVLWTLAWTGALLAGLGVAGVALHLDRWAMQATGLWRASATLTYANAAAALLLLTLPAAILLTSRSRGGPARAMSALIVTGLLATGSRGGLLGAMAMLLIGALLGAWPTIRFAARPLLGGCLGAAGLIPSMVSDGPRPWAALAGVAAGFVVAAWPRKTLPKGAEVLRRRRRALAFAGLLAVAAVLVAAGGPRIAAQRLTLAGEGRLDNWSRTLERGPEHPVFGTGLPAFEGSARIFTHNEYLQVFADTGLVGVAAVGTALVLFTRWAIGARSRGGDLRVWAMSVAAMTAFAIQSATDFLWRFPVLVLMAFVWLATAGTRPAAVQRGRNDGNDT